MGSAGYIPGVARLGIPPLWETDASLGVATQRDSTEPYRVRTSLPSSLATAATFDPALAYRGGVMIGREARASGFNLMLAGGSNLVREPRNGRNFEYVGEDPLLAGVMTGAAVRGIQSNHLISTVKHFALNGQETGRMVVSSNIADAPARQSDLLAFQIAIEQGRPGSVMCAYNRVNSVYACENPELLGVLKGDWKYPGFVMSDWGAVHSVAPAVNAGLDQESGFTLDDQPYFDAKLAQAVASGEVSPARLDDMALRIVRAMAANGLLTHPVRPGGLIDLAADAKVSQADAEAGIVLLKNTEGLLPLARGAGRVVVIGGHADKGVIAGGGSSTVFPEGVTAVPGLEPRTWPGPVVFDPSPPLAAILDRVGAEHATWLDGSDVAAAVKAAKAADMVIVFGTQWTAESQDAALSLDGDQDALISAVTAANPKSVVVLETGGPVRMPWLDKAGAVLEAWYPGSGGGEAIARVLFGEVDASGRLPVTFPRDEGQLPRPHLDGAGTDGATPFTVDYDIEGAAVGYKWFDRQGLKPLFPFGYGLSYTRFEYSGLRAQQTGGRFYVSFRVRNIGDRPGQAVPQVYVSRPGGGWEAPKRLAGWSKQALRPGESRRVFLEVDPRLLAVWDEGKHDWSIAGGPLEVLLGSSSRDITERVSVVTPARRLPAGWRPSASRP
jgi:beta-glucosidase